MAYPGGIVFRQEVTDNAREIKAMANYRFRLGRGVDEGERRPPTIS